MKGLDALAKTCTPEPVETPATPAAVQLSEDQLKTLTDMIIKQLQSPAPAQAETQTPDPDTEDPEEGDSTDGND